MFLNSSAAHGLKDKSFLVHDTTQESWAKEDLTSVLPPDTWTEQ